MINYVFQNERSQAPTLNPSSYIPLSYPYYHHPILQNYSSQNQLETLYQIKTQCYQSSLLALQHSKLRLTHTQNPLNKFLHIFDSTKSFYSLFSGAPSLEKLEENQTPFYKVETSMSHKETFKETQSFDQIKPLVVNMLKFFIEEFGRNNQQEITKERQKYTLNPNLLNLFDCLIERYTITSKGREDMIRFIIRKALIFLKNSIREDGNLTVKRASVTFCQKYFKTYTKKTEDDEEEIVDFFLPYKKKSKNKTANNCFISEIFASDVFNQDYLIYLKNIDKVFQQDNEKKISKFVAVLVHCVQEGNFEKVKTFKRLPWLNKWLETSKIIAYELPSINKMKGIKKNSKQWENKKQLKIQNSLISLNEKASN